MTVPLSNNTNIYEEIQRCIYNCYQIINGSNGQYVAPNKLLKDKSNSRNLVIMVNDSYHTLLRWSSGKDISAIMYHSIDKNHHKNKYQYVSDENAENILNNNHILANGVFYLYRINQKKYSILCDNISLNLKSTSNGICHNLCHHFLQHIFLNFVQLSFESVTEDSLNNFFKIWNISRLFIEIIHGIVSSNMKIIHYYSVSNARNISICYAVYTKVVDVNESMKESNITMRESSLSLFKKIDIDIDNSTVSISDIKASGNKVTLPLESFNITHL
jgi:hypothetical protein